MTKKSTPSTAAAAAAAPAAGKRKAAASNLKTPIAPRKLASKSTSKPPAPSAPEATLPKKDQLIALLKSPAGTTIDAMTALTGWQAHTVRGVISAVLRKKLGLTVVCEKTSQGHRYKIAAAA